MPDHERLARQSNRVVRRWPRAQRAMSRMHAHLYRISGEVTVGRQRRTVRPRELKGAEYHRLLRRFVQMYPQAEHYARFTDRPLPLIALEPKTE